MDVSGWLISCTMEAVISPTRASRATWASSSRVVASSFSACLRSVMSRQVQEHRSALDRDPLQVDQHDAPLARLREDLALDVAELAARRQLRGIEEVLTQEPAQGPHRVHLVRQVAEDHVHVGADEGEGARVVAREDGVRDVLDGGAVELFRRAQRLVTALASTVRRARHGEPPGEVRAIVLRPPTPPARSGTAMVRIDLGWSVCGSGNVVVGSSGMSPARATPPAPRQAAHPDRRRHARHP